MSTNLSNYDINVYKGNTFKLDFLYTDNLNIGIDLSNHEAKMQIRRSRYDDKLIAELTENYPSGCFGMGLSGDFYSGQGFLGYTGGLILNYEDKPGNVHIEIDTETCFAIPEAKHEYDLQLIDLTKRTQKTVLRGRFNILPSIVSIERTIPSFDPEIIGESR